MQCPCGSADVSPRDFRDWLRATQEARMQARQVVKGEAFHGAIVQRTDKGLYLGPERAEQVAEVTPDGAAGAVAARGGPDETLQPSGALRRLWGLLGGLGGGTG
jgi:hypothetical protein